MGRGYKLYRCCLCMALLVPSVKFVEGPNRPHFGPKPYTSDKGTICSPATEANKPRSVKKSRASNITTHSYVIAFAEDAICWENLAKIGSDKLILNLSGQSPRTQPTRVGRCLYTFVARAQYQAQACSDPTPLAMRAEGSDPTPLETQAQACRGIARMA